MEVETLIREKRKGRSSIKSERSPLIAMGGSRARPSGRVRTGSCGEGSAFQGEVDWILGRGGKVQQEVQSRVVSGPRLIPLSLLSGCSFRLMPLRSLERQPTWR